MKAGSVATPYSNPGAPAGSWRVTEIGGYPEYRERPGRRAAGPSTETIDAPASGHGMEDRRVHDLRRSYQNTVLLPDRSMVAVGGGIGETDADEEYAIDPNGKQRQVEL